MLFRQLFDQQSYTYTYLIASNQSKEAVIVDPVSEQFERDKQLIEELDLTLKYILETHIHADHITSAYLLKQYFGSQIVVPAPAHVENADSTIHENDYIILNEVPIKAIATPGHTDAHMAYLVNQDRILTGDALFIRGCGRTDFQSGNPGLLYDCIVNKIFSLPDDILLYPGHDYKGFTVSTVGEEKLYNPRLANKTRHEFITMMNQLNLPKPKKIDEALPRNLKCGKE